MRRPRERSTFLLLSLLGLAATMCMAGCSPGRGDRPRPDTDVDAGTDASTDASEDAEPPVECRDGTPLNECSTGNGGRGGPPQRCVLGREGEPRLWPDCEQCGCPEDAPFCVPESYADLGPIVPVGQCFDQDLEEALQSELLACRMMSPDMTGDIGLTGADLGVPVWHQGELYYFFGDASSGRNPVATSDTGFCPELEWFVTSEGLADSMIDWDTAEFNRDDSNVPSGAISLDGTLYVYIMHCDWGSGDTGSYLVKSTTPDWTEDGWFEPVGGVVWPVRTPSESFTKMGNIAPVLVETEERRQICFLAAGQYGASSIYLGCTPDIEDKRAYRYFTGLDGDESPTWSRNEDDAVPVIDDGVKVAELSVHWSEEIGKYVVIFSNRATGSLWYASAENLWGPWERTLHRIPGFEPTWLRWYAGYVVPEMSQGNRLFVVVSIWFPYTSYIVELDLEELERGG